VDKGARFVVTLPISIAAQSGSEGQDSVHPGIDGVTKGDMPSLSGLRVLIVEDDPDSREMISMILEQASAEVAAAANVPQAIDLLDRWDSNVLISDIGMPSEDGYDLRTWDYPS
jgi:PleD family two-component response regulator